MGGIFTAEVPPSLDDSSLCTIDKELTGTALMRLTVKWRSREWWMSSQFMRKWVSLGEKTGCEGMLWGYLVQDTPEDKPFRNQARKHTKASLPGHLLFPLLPQSILFHPMAAWLQTTPSLFVSVAPSSEGAGGFQDRGLCRTMCAMELHYFLSWF